MTCSECDIRPALAEALADLAEQERQRGNLLLAAAYDRSAEIALGFVVQPGPSKALCGQKGGEAMKIQAPPFYTRLAVAEHRATPPETLIALASDPDAGVRYDAARQLAERETKP